MNAEEEELLQDIRKELKKTAGKLDHTNALIAGIGGFFVRLTLWGLLAASLYGIGIATLNSLLDEAAVIPFFLGALAAIGGVLHAASALLEPLAAQNPARVKSSPAASSANDWNLKRAVRNAPPSVCSCTSWQRGFGNTEYRYGVEYCRRCLGPLPLGPK